MRVESAQGSYQIRSHATDTPAFVMCASGETVTFGELEARANQGAHLLRNAGVRVGDHIAILMENRREFLEICFAADRCGVYYTTISSHLSFDEIAYILDDCGARVLVGSKLFTDTLVELDKSLRSSCDFYTVGDTDPDMTCWNTAAAVMPTTPIEDEVQGMDMLYSSGTTGKPKGIKWPMSTDCPPGGRTMLIDLLTSLFGYASSTRYLSPAPLYHAAPLRHSMVTMKMGGTVYIMDRFNAVEALHLIERFSITHSQWVPTMFVRLLKLPEKQRRQFDISSMRMAVHAAAPCPLDVKREMIAWWGDIIHEYYSGTENNGFTSITTAEWLAHPGSVGQAKLGVPHICDEHGNEIPGDREGEIYFENGHQFVYHNDREKTARCTNDKGWTTLGDIGYLDKNGYLYLTDRKSFVIISGGINVYPQETENILISHPMVMDAAVIGIPDEDFGESVLAIVQLIQAETASTDLEDELVSFCKERLSTIKCPRRIEFRESLPRSATGKLYKRKLKSEYWP